MQNFLKLPNAFNASTLHPYTLNNTPHSSRVSFLIPKKGGRRIEANAGKREQRLLADYAEREHFRAAAGWSIEANAGKRGQRLLADYAEREHFRAREAWSIES